MTGGGARNKASHHREDDVDYIEKQIEKQVKRLQDAQTDREVELIERKLRVLKSLL